MRLRVLLAEDDPDHLFFTTRALREIGVGAIDIDTVRDGEEALDYLFRRGPFSEQARPHFVMLDIRMPRVDGLTVLAQIKRDDALKTIPVIVLTSSDRPEDVQEAYRGGANTYVTKPVEPAGLLSALRELSKFWTDLASLPDPPA